MGKRQLKAAIIGSFVLGAGIFYFSDADSARAQRDARPEKKEAVLASVAGYKSWHVASKPAPGTATDTFAVTSSLFTA